MIKPLSKKIISIFKLTIVGLLGLSAFINAGTIDDSMTSNVGSDANWQTGLSVPSDSAANAACSVVTGIPFSCTLPASGADTVSCSAVNVPAGVTVSSACVMTGTQTGDFSVEVSFDDGVSDALSRVINLTTGPNQNPVASDPTSGTCTNDITSGSSYSCDLASTVSDPESQSLTYTIVQPSWASFSGSAISGTPTVAGSVAIEYSVSDGVNTVNNTYNITVIQNTANLLEDTSSTMTTAQLTDGGVSSAITTALSTNTCGSSGDQSCLAAFNTYKASTSCTLAGGASATASQMDSYVSCVVYESFTADASAVSTTPAAESASSGCGQSVNVPMPPMCGYSAWTCPITNLPTDWVNNGQTVSIPDNAAATNITLNVEMRLASWTNHLIKTVSQPVNVSAAIAGATNGNKLYHGGNTGISGASNRRSNVWAAYDFCVAQGGDLATLAEAEASGVLGTTTLYYGQKSGSTSRPAKPFWNASRYGTNYKGMSENGTQKYIQVPGSYVCTAMNRYTCGGNSATTKYFVCKNLPSCSD